MRGRLYIYDKIQEFTAYLIKLKCPMEVSTLNLGIDFALGDERRIHPVPTNHSVGRRVRHRKFDRWEAFMMHLIDSHHQCTSDRRTFLRRSLIKPYGKEGVNGRRY